MKLEFILKTIKNLIDAAVKIAALLEQEVRTPEPALCDS